MERTAAAIEMWPLVVTARLTLGRRRRGIGVTRQPAAHVVFVILFVPYHSGKRLPLDQASVFVFHAGLNPEVEIIAVAFSRAGDLIEISKRRRVLSVRQAQAEPCRGAGAYHGTEVHAGLRTAQQRVHRRPAPMHQVFVKSILVIALGCASIEARDVGLVLAKQQLGVIFCVEIVGAQLGMARDKNRGPGR